MRLRASEAGAKMIVRHIVSILLLFRIFTTTVPTKYFPRTLISSMVVLARARYVLSSTDVRPPFARLLSYTARLRSFLTRIVPTIQTPPTHTKLASLIGEASFRDVQVDR